MSPKRGKAGAEWRPTAPQLELLRELRYRGPTPWPVLAKVLGVREDSAGTSPTVRSLIARRLVTVSSGEVLQLTTEAVTYLSVPCLRLSRHLPARGQPERCEECGVRLAVGPMEVTARVRQLRGQVSEALAHAGRAASVAHQSGGNADAALLESVRASLRSAQVALERVAPEVSAPGGRDVVDVDRSLRATLAFLGPTALAGPVERLVEQLAEAGWEVVAGPRPWRAESVSDGARVEADTLAGLVAAARVARARGPA